MAQTSTFRRAHVDDENSELDQKMAKLCESVLVFGYQQELLADKKYI